MSIVPLLEAAGLAGRGGAAFSTATKVAAAADHRAHLVVNACDGEIGAAKDGWVVEHHLAELVEGAAMLSPRRRRTIRYAAHRGSVTAARLRSAGLDVLEVPARYVSSEETALISLATGGLARPMTRRAPFVAGGRDSSGRRIRPTVVINAETVWRAAQIAQYGPVWFRSMGTEDEPGPRLVTVHTASARAVVLETEAGPPMLALIDAAGGLETHAESVLVGGIGGVFVPGMAVRSLRWSSRQLAPYGGSIGPGIIATVTPEECPVRLVDRFLAYAAGESAGQCGPCMFGLPALASDWNAFSRNPADALLRRMSGRVALLAGRGACRFPDGVGRFVASAMSVYADHLLGHVRGVCLEPGRREFRGVQR